MIEIKYLSGKWYLIPKVFIHLFIYSYNFPTSGQWVIALKSTHLNFTGSHKTPVVSGSDKIIYSPLDYVGVLMGTS